MLDILAGPTGGLAAGALAVLHVALSVLVTAHVLLRKREVGSATGWIGLSWLSPFLGSALYFLFGINRVRQRARALGHTEAPPAEHGAAQAAQAEGSVFEALDRTGFALTRRPAAPGNAAWMLRDGDEAYPRMLAAIEAAAGRVLLSSYIFRDDAAGAPFIDALVRAQRRGVEVRVLIDGIGGGYFLSAAYRRLRRSGVPAARFLHSPLPWNMPFLNLRSHKKILVVDDRIGFTGGLNIGRENLVRTGPPEPVRDTHFEFRGPLARQLAEAFAADWAFATGRALPPPAEAPPQPGPGVATARVITSGPDQDLEKIEIAMLQAVTCARRSVLVMTPYFLPEDRLVSALALAALRGVEVEVVVPERSNHRLLDCAMRAHVGPMLRAGCRIWLNPPPFDHSKLMVVDGGWSLVGSSNWDMRSLRLNFELNVELYDPATAGMIAERIRAARGRRLRAGDLARRGLPVRLRDAALRLALPYV
ncbi:phospholipase D-like domain-containing protein [Roseicella aquatilis]|uniref:Phospholipase D n=1 Tax=Roseicella aquatilis TaxID=2527868 RepID=A0A4R4DX15_9PROT|nr:phospholipase D-like domain-containing protein [Roseicella aquatilis]TCZ66071.1 cardiolipin synthase [Roseicella aquatilis]